MFKVRQMVMVVLLLAQGIFEALREMEDFTQLEERVQRITQEAARKLLINALEELDKRLLGQKEKGLKVVGNRKRPLLTSIGELTFRRWGLGSPIALIFAPAKAACSFPGIHLPMKQVQVGLNSPDLVKWAIDQYGRPLPRGSYPVASGPPCLARYMAASAAASSSSPVVPWTG